MQSNDLHSSNHASPRENQGCRALQLYNVACYLSVACFSCTVCGDPTSTITLIDLLDGTCGWFFGEPSDRFKSTLKPCTQPAFGQTCGSYRGLLQIVYYLNSTTLQPNTQAYLDGIGLGQINTVADLTISRIPGTWPGTIAPVFLTSLVHVTGSLYVQKSGGVTDEVIPITALPGLANVMQVGNLAIESDTLITRPDFANLQCVGGGIGFFRNPQQTTLVGMDKLIQVNYVPVYTTGSTVIIQRANAITTPAALAPLSTAANCGGAPPPLTPSISIPGCLYTIATWDALCTYIASGACPPPPPPPPPSPPS